MADRYWVGDGGNWSDTAHWSLSNGGAGGASVPGQNDNGLFLSTSVTSDQTIVLNVNINCKSINIEGVDNLTFDSSDVDVVVRQWISPNGEYNVLMGAGEWRFLATDSILNSDRFFFMQTGGGVWTRETSSVVIDFSSLTISPRVSEPDAYFQTSTGFSFDESLSWNDVTYVGHASNLYWIAHTNFGDPTDFTIADFSIVSNPLKITFQEGMEVNCDYIDLQIPGTILGANNDLGAAPSSPAILTADAIDIRHLEVSYITAGGVASPFVDIGGEDGGNNTNWLFGDAEGFYYQDNNVAYKAGI